MKNNQFAIVCLDCFRVYNGLWYHPDPQGFVPGAVIPERALFETKEKADAAARLDGWTVDDLEHQPYHLCPVCTTFRIVQIQNLRKVQHRLRTRQGRYIEIAAEIA